jgi:hypothetical protein
MAVAPDPSISKPQRSQHSNDFGIAGFLLTPLGGKYIKCLYPPP